ncbi:hypothetical protein [Sphingomicrobium sediminis]|uniref:Uncharacterized protein n=1 Tax=Sphingomicrobium sediminis TaxID=2950949 RepID=A0A9X2EHC8_9SPHN|nr:hypothetical protein [Sphingomicrobium sediminis]MCM8557557.1 hypothetical protein [Sphingomicrobium sediminis]
MMKPFIPRAPIIMGSITGTFIGSILLIVALLLFDREGFDAGLQEIPLLLMMTALLVPISAFAIVIFGYPAAAAVGEAWRKPWVGIAALLMGGLAGLITRITLVSVFAGGFARPGGLGVMPVDAGIIYGASVGLAYWMFERDWRLRDEARRAAEGPGEEVPSSTEFSQLP